MHKKKIYTSISISIFLIIVVYVLLTPNWIIKATQDEFLVWYPHLGNIMYFLIHYIIPFIITLFIVFVIVSSANKIYRLIKSLFGNLVFYLKRNKGEAYFGVVLILTLQFYYCYNFEEFYPAVIMPRFSEGKAISVVEKTHGELIIHFERNVDTINVIQLLPFKIISSFGQSVAINRFLGKCEDKEVQDWLLNNVRKNVVNDLIKNIEIYRVRDVYQYDGFTHLRRRYTNWELLNTFDYYEFENK